LRTNDGIDRGYGIVRPAQGGEIGGITASDCREGEDDKEGQSIHNFSFWMHEFVLYCGQ
jgi:hypothetical protein